MNDHYCPQHKQIANIIIDTFPARCGECCSKAGGPGDTATGGCCPALFSEVSPEFFADRHARQPFANAEYAVVGARYFVDDRVLLGRR